MFSRLFYWLKNLPAHWRALFYGSSNTDGKVSFRGELRAKIIRGNGKVVDLGVISRRVVTTAGVNYMRDDFAAAAGSADITNFKYHDSGTGTTAEAVGDVDLVTPAGPSTRATGTQVAFASKQYQTVGTLAYTTTLAITEHGIFTVATQGNGTGNSGTLWDRSKFAAINVVNGDSIQFTYTLTINDGG